MAPGQPGFDDLRRCSGAEWTYDHDNRLATFNGNNVTIDGQGNLTYGPGTNNTFQTYTYDARNRLTSAGGLNYGYDPAGNRTSLTNGSTNETFAVDPKTSQVLMRIKPGVTNYYVYGAGLLYEIDVAGTNTTTLYYHFDSRGSTVALTDTNGNITDRMEYGAYGMLTYRLGTNDTPFLYNGRYGVQTDPNGLLFMRARYYNPYICRFLNADPSGFAGGLNMYAFADGNPISEMDPFGLGYWSDVGSVWVGYGQAAVGTVTGLYNVAAHPINTAVGLYNVATSPVQAYNAISTSVVNTWNSGPQGQGQIVGNLLIAGATAGSGFATATTRAAAIAAAEPGLADGMSTLQILSTYDKGAQALNAADYAAYGYDLQDLSPAGNLYRGLLMQQGVDLNGDAYAMTTTLGQATGTSFTLAGTGLTPGAGIVPGLLGTGAEATGWLGNSGALGNLQQSWSLFGNTTSQSSSTGK
jgi:RHS repeat-associated protein